MNYHRAWTEEKIRQTVDTIKRFKDWPVPGVDFIDIMPILRNPEICQTIMYEMIELAIRFKPTAILAIEARGFLFAPQIASNLMIPLVCARKFGKLPGEVWSKKCLNEYDQSFLSIQKQSLSGKDVLVIDDVIATGNTMLLCKDLIELDSGTFVGGLGLFNLEYITRSDDINRLNLQSWIQMAK